MTDLTPHPRINPRRFWAVALPTSLGTLALAGIVSATLGAIAGIAAIAAAIALTAIIARATALWILEESPARAPQWTEDQL